MLFILFCRFKTILNLLYEKEVNSWIKNHGTHNFPKSYETVENFFKNNIDFYRTWKIKKTRIIFTLENILNKEFYNDIKDVNLMLWIHMAPI